MDLYRTRAVPKAYSNLDFVREGKGIFTDTPEDMERIEFFQSILKGQKCLSELDSEHFMVVKADIPSEVLSLKGESGKLLEWKFYFYKPRDGDLATRPDKPLPYEAIGLVEAGISKSFLGFLSVP